MELTLKLLTLKFVVLLGLLSGQRYQILHCLNIKDMHGFGRIEMCLPFDKFVKNICTDILQKIQNLFGTSKTFLAHPKSKVMRDELPERLFKENTSFEAVSCDTISRWLKSVLDMAGVDTTIFTAHIAHE